MRTVGSGLSKARTGFRDFIDSGGLHKPDDLAELQAAVETIPVTSADAERGLSNMNIIASPIQNRLSVERLSKLMFASQSHWATTGIIQCSFVC